MKKYFFTLLLGLSAQLLVAQSVFAQQPASTDISNTRSLIFVADQEENLIDVLSINSLETLYRIETSIRPDHLTATPFAPLLVYADIEAGKLGIYDLKNKVESKVIDLPLKPRHMVLDTTGTRVGISDKVDGGFALIDVIAKEIELAIEEFPATPDVLFDANESEIFYSNSKTGSIGILSSLSGNYNEVPISDRQGETLTAPSRSLNGRYIYVGNVSSGEVYGLNAFSGAVFKTFDVGGVLARPYTTPEGVFLYMIDQENGKLVSVQQYGFRPFAEVDFQHPIDLVVVGRFDHLNLFLSTETNQWAIFDNIGKGIVEEGEFHGQPISALGSADGKFAYVAMKDQPELAVVDLAKGSIEYVAATNNGSGAFTLGLSNNVCH